MALQISRRSSCLPLALLAVLVATPALAGPPLVCFPFDIGTQTSLPWNGTGGWEGSRPDYDTSRLTGDTIALLTPQTPIIVRMETLRRAAIYATKDARAARGLLDALLARAKSASGTGSAEAALAEFDAGYLIATYRQTTFRSSTTGDLVANLDGYKLVQHALAARNGDPAIAFAAAIMSMGPRTPDYAAHVKQARAGASADLLLARNIDHLGQ
jgi:hypothetical protein